MKLLRLFLVGLALHSWSAAAAPAQSVAGLNKFLETNTDTIYDILSRIHAHTMTEHERFLVLTADNGGYVQCMFHDNDTEIYCESSSGFYQTPEPRILPKQHRAIAAQGFSMEGKQGNFNLNVPMDGESTLWNIAGLMLETLYRGYGSGHFTMNAPLIMPEPPQPVPCENDTTCDRDPEHLEAFVAGFYRWYVANLDEFDSIDKDHAEPKVLHKRIVEFAHQEKRIMKERLTDSLRAWHNKITGAEPGTYIGDSYHCSTETDFILCLQDWDSDWVYNAFAQEGSFNGNTADVLLTLPVGHHFDYKNGPLKRLVHLKVEKGRWKIDGVTELRNELHSDK